ncbi:MAG: PcfB family protein [Lachnospiraceae bacterium]|nr:PcfB family protein [Lachnospiraceae bacterium]
MVQEEVEHKTVHLAVRTLEISAREFARALKRYMEELHRKNKELKAASKDEPVKGKQSVKELIGQGQGVSSMEIGDSGVRDFKRIANKYGVDFAIVKDKEGDPPKYTVFFKAKDADAITQVLKDYAHKQTKRKELNERERPSILAELRRFKEKVASMPHKERERKKEREL